MGKKKPDKVMTVDVKTWLHNMRAEGFRKPPTIFADDPDEATDDDHYSGYVVGYRRGPYTYPLAGNMTLWAAEYLVDKITREFFPDHVTPDIQPGHGDNR